MKILSLYFPLLEVLRECRDMEHSTDGYRPLSSLKCLYKRERAQRLRRTLTEAERILWSRLKANRLRGMHFRQQHVVAGFIVDFYCHDTRLVIEVDGEIHDKQREYDAERDQVLSDLGLRVLRFTNDAVKYDLRQVMLTIGSFAGP